MRRPILFLTLTLCAAPLFAGARLTYTLGGGPKPVFWSADSFPIPYAIDRRVVDKLAGAQAIIDRAFADWASVPDANVRFAPQGIVDVPGAGKDGRNTITLADDLFRNQNFIAVTTNWYDNNGRMEEADIQIDASLINGNYNMEQLVEHEAGHLLGLDHSGVISSVMFPYVGRGVGVSLDSDDRIAIASLYPRSDPNLIGATLQGRVVGDNGGVFAAQVVALDDRGSPVATALSEEDGSFVLRALPTGTYRVYAEPLDGPMNVRNLSGVWRQATVTSFTTRFLDQPPMPVVSGKVYGNLIVNIAGAPQRLNPMWIGTCAANGVDTNLGSTALSVRPGQTVTVAIAGDGFTSGMTKFEIPNPAFHRTTDFKYGSNYVSATFTIAPDAPNGSSVVLVTSGNEKATLTGGLRVTGGILRGRAAPK